ncbi:uncharacterized protein LOC100573751 [Acyrthosiphon pisum]|uniref:Uncharacterized protein n=1 Tax=Acyrthosiphon pisum TaxID=7029 RepID=A0A8R2H765_ACYPI|nr:uncharacterized protein LOC100573751 [Acyrthosiphon pisum]|eukprot:XP_016663008.1 PREDICTED: uncharacterized protein LOC100573751 [Acyrthosiphon pisum]
MEPSPAARPQPLRELPHGQAQNGRQTTTDDASSEPCYIDDVAATVAEKVTAATVVDRLETAATMTAVDGNNLTAVTAADEEVTAAAAPATLQITTDEKAVTAAARVSEVIENEINKKKEVIISVIPHMQVQVNLYRTILSCYHNVTLKQLGGGGFRG